jgi:TetR/AcrR family transcriptional repressor of nem operon
MPRPSLREHVIAAAVEQFHRRGYHASGVKDITDAANLPKGSFYNYFSSKEEMALEALRRYGLGRQLERLRDPSTPPVERLRAHFVFFGDDLNHDGTNLGCMFGNFAAESISTGPALRDAVGNAWNHWIAALTAALTEMKELGELPADRDVDLLARSLARAWQGTVLHAKVLQDSAPIDDFFAGVFEPLLALPPR